MRHSLPRIGPPCDGTRSIDPPLSAGGRVADRAAMRRGTAGERDGSATISKGGCIGGASPQFNVVRCRVLIGNSLLTDPALRSRRLVAAGIATPLAGAAYHAAPPSATPADASWPLVVADNPGRGPLPPTPQCGALAPTSACIAWPMPSTLRWNIGKMRWMMRPVCVPVGLVVGVDPDAALEVLGEAA